jgi:hypothetical protein
MKKVFEKTFGIVIFGLSLILAIFFIYNRFEVRSAHANTNESSYEKKVVKIFETKEPEYQNLSLEEIDRRINSFFSYLDEQQYVKSYKFLCGSKQQFEQLLKVLIANPPSVPRETDSIDRLLKNVFYFYRLLGKEKLGLAKDILKNESDIIEPLMHTFYMLFTSGNEYAILKSARSSIEQLYVYACFFLETFGGRSYLLRRDSKVRILILYYCVLIIDQANIHGVNSNGLDIRPHIKLVLDDITHQIGLNYKNQYFMKLETLRKKYRLS